MGMKEEKLGGRRMIFLQEIKWDDIRMSSQCEKGDGKRMMCPSRDKMECKKNVSLHGKEVEEECVLPE